MDNQIKSETDPSLIKKLKTKRTNLSRRLKRESIAASLNKNGYSAFWKIIRTQPKPIVFKTESGTTSNPKEVVEILTKEFQHTQPPPKLNLDASLLSLRAVVEHLPQWEFELVSGSHMDSVLSQLPNKKSTGPDPCSFQLLKILSPVISHLLTSLCNQIIRQRKWPATLAQAKIVPVPKKKKFQYRKIGITSAVGWIISKTIGEQL